MALLKDTAAWKLFTDMFQSLAEDVFHMRICQRINGRSAVLAKFYEFTPSEHLELVRNCGLAHLKQNGNITNTQVIFRQLSKIFEKL